MAVQELIAEGTQAFERGDAEASRQAFEAAIAEGETGELLEGLARARYLGRDYQGSMEAHERAFRNYKDEGDLLGAARSARILSWLHLNARGDWAVSGGWLALAGTVLEAAGGDGSERGWIELMRAAQEPHGESRERLLNQAMEHGKRSGDADLEFAALAELGEQLVMTGRVEEGMLLFDEALAAICAGETRDIYVLEGVFCALFLTCERVHDVARADQWMRAAGELAQRRGLVPVGALCRAHYGGILMTAGRWDEAEIELNEAARVFEGTYGGAGVIVLVRLADLRVRQGRLEEAAVLIEGLDQVPDAARPLAALHLARGETALARDLLQRRLGMPMMPAPWPISTAVPGPVEGPLLMLLLDAHLADGALDDARATASRLSDLADANPSPYLQACAALAEGKICVASESGDALACLREALEAFMRAQTPVELAQARLELARASAADQPEVAVAEAKAALDAFERRMAARDADAAASLLRSLGAAGRSAPKRRTPLTKRELEVLDLLGHGLSNPEIADRLFIAPKTAEHHVGNILSKLDLRNRAEAAAYAARTAGQSQGTE